MRTQSLSRCPGASVVMNWWAGPGQCAGGPCAFADITVTATSREQANVARSSLFTPLSFRCFLRIDHDRRILASGVNADLVLVAATVVVLSEIPGNALAARAIGLRKRRTAAGTRRRWRSRNEAGDSER